MSESDVALMATAPGTTASMPVVEVEGPSPAVRAATGPTSSGKSLVVLNGALGLLLWAGGNKQVQQ